MLVLPYKRRPWGCGPGAKGSWNNCRIQWEVCEPAGHTYSGGTMIAYDATANAGYFNRMWKMLVAWNVYCAVELGYDATAINDHAESYRAGMGSNHADMGQWLPKHGKSMDALRTEVAAVLNAQSGEEVIHLDMSKEELRALIREVIDEADPVYKDIKDVPPCWQPQAQAMLEAGAVNGGTDTKVCATDLNLRKETLKAAIVAIAYHDVRSQQEA